MKISIINLETSTDRRKKISEQLDSLNISYELFPAIDGHTKKHPLFNKYNDNRRKLYKRYRLSPSQLGCYASHYLLWEKCLKLNEPIVVMEDDVIVDTHFSYACDLAQKLIDIYGYIRLCSLFNKPFVKIAHYGSYEIVRYLKGPSGAQCYVIHPKAAKVLLTYSQQWFIPVDDYLDKFWLHNIDCIGLMPYSIRVYDNETTIIGDKVIVDSILDHLIRRINRYLDRLKRLYYNIDYET